MNLSRLITPLLRLIPDDRMRALLFRTIRAYALSLPPAEALRFLFSLDQYLYDLQGLQAVQYGQGLHPKHRHTKYHDFFIQNIQPGQHVLDIGCGIGALAHDVARHTGASIIAMDIEKSNIEKARQMFPHPGVDYRVGDVFKDLPEERQDVIILSNVLEHLSDRIGLLRKIQALLMPKKFLIRVPLYERDWRVPLKQELGVEWRLDPTHETEYTLESFKEEMTGAGLEIQQIQCQWGEIWAVLSGESA